MMVAGARNCFHRLFAAPGLTAIQFQRIPQSYVQSVDNRYVAGFISDTA